MTGLEYPTDPHLGNGAVATKDRLRRGIGISEATDSRAAGRAAAHAAVAALEGERAALILVYSAISYDLAELLAGVREITGDTALAGATTSGHFHDGQVTRAGRGVAVLALTAGPYRFGVGAVTGVHAGAFTAGRAMARMARAATGGEPAPYGALMILADGLAGHHHALLAGVHKVTGAGVPVVGGAAADDRLLTRTWVFAGDRVLEDGAVAVWIASPWPLNVVAAHGWRPTGLPMLVTKVDGQVVHELGGRPAAEVFRSCFHDHHPPEVDGTPCRCPCCAHAELKCARTTEASQDGAHRHEGYHATHALGVMEPDGSQLIRGAYVGDDGQLRTFCPLPVYSAVQVVSSRPDDLLEVADEVVPRALDGRDASIVLLFSCVARWDVLGDRGPEEAVRLQAAAGDSSTFGFYTYGEFARTSSVSGYHNATLAAIAL
jgi:hypothetical protein